MGIQFKRLFSNPIFIGTLTLMFGGLFVSIICAGIKSVYIAATTWFMIVYLFVLALALVLAIITNTLNQYRLALLTMLGVGLSATIGHIGYYINAVSGTLQAMSAGLIFVEITMFFWVLVLGSGPGTYLASLCGMSSEGKSAAGISMANVSTARPNYRATVHSTAGAGAGGSIITDYYASELSQSVISSKQPDPASDMYKARALYAYESNPDDPNEVSIVKDEIMQVIDDSGKWWQVKKDDGTVGIAPSNYLTRIAS
ncbi:Transmembrane osmosensor [Coemansia spiralis]|uniref:Transmembrane osmosensor n=2 Tax=Coemansia TaxID=4863 RepID=A0A9W8G476_9FUNG|nr:hypothetical protein BX070DRAFT_251090 [Coemansia spiralis]KAJ1996217.1 Transmembrane osmosensor [Coemansia umbellata]KAJ2626027.1 Transmembrane osmosensor [Coemansia sp. RSA 1358]KAJ2678619.1 Transmembrane osmosensor [Coemansia spiralis]